MASPPTTPSQLQGASHTTGGVIRGQAYGNVFNFANSYDLGVDHAAPVVGKVHLYDLRIDPTHTKPKAVFKLQVTTSLGTVLFKLAEKDSPVRCRSLINYYQDLVF
jgi:hypothetical protein